MEKRLEVHMTPLLLLVQANVAPEHENAFNAWYYHHAPALLEIPGYGWGGAMSIRPSILSASLMQRTGNGE